MKDPLWGSLDSCLFFSMEKRLSVQKNDQEETGNISEIFSYL